MTWDTLLFNTFDVFIDKPLFAFLPALAFGGLYWLKRRTGILVAACCWGAYATLETLNKARITCSGECNIRVDLLIAYPLLWIVSIVAVALFCLPGKRDGDA